MKKELQNYKKSREEFRLILKALKGWINRNYGKRCEERANGCFVCIAWEIYDLLYVYFDE